MEIKKEDQLTEQTPPVDYTEQEIKYRGYLVKRLESAKKQREQAYVELNDMDYLTYYNTNLKAANSYIQPKKNKQDVRVVTGTTEEKELTLLSAILNYNLEANIEAYDKNNLPIYQLGEQMESLIKKSREIEDYDIKRELIYKELLDQGTCYVEEQTIERICLYKKMKNAWTPEQNIKNASWTETQEKEPPQCEAQLISGDKVFLGNFRQFFISKQPYIFTLSTVSYEEAKTIYGSWLRWENVPKKVVKISDADYTIEARDWSLFEQEAEVVEIIKYQDKPNNEYQIMLNGVMMLPVRYPLEVISPSREYTIAKGDVSPISEFIAVSKSIPAKTKVDQQLLDEMLRLIILKTRKSFMPSYANNTGRPLTSKIFDPGSIHNNLDPNKIQPIGETDGVNPAEFSTFEFIKRLVDEKSVSPVFSGDQQVGQQTATEILEVKKQQMMKLGLTMYGVINLEKQLNYLRTKNILATWTNKIDERVNDITKQLEEVFRSETVDANLSDGQQGKKIIQFTNDTESISPENVLMENRMLSEALKKPVEKIYLNTVIKNFKLRWFFTITPTEKDSSALDRVLFIQNLKDAMMIFGPQALNMEYQKIRFAMHSKEDPDKFFIKEAPVMPSQELGGQGSQIVSQMMQGTKQPSLNQLIGQ